MFKECRENNICKIMRVIFECAKCFQSQQISQRLPGTKAMAGYKQKKQIITAVIIKPQQIKR